MTDGRRVRTTASITRLMVAAMVLDQRDPCLPVLWTQGDSQSPRLVDLALAYAARALHSHFSLRSICWYWYAVETLLPVVV